MSALLLAAALADRAWLDADRRRHRLDVPSLAAVASACGVCAATPGPGSRRSEICFMAPDRCVTPARDTAAGGYDPLAWDGPICG